LFKSRGCCWLFLSLTFASFLLRNRDERSNDNRSFSPLRFAYNLGQHGLDWRRDGGLHDMLRSGRNVYGYMIHVARLAALWRLRIDNRNMFATNGYGYMIHVARLAALWRLRIDDRNMFATKEIVAAIASK
jgi:hypothetical protein